MNKYEMLKRVIAYGKFIFTTFRGYRVTILVSCKGLNLAEEHGRCHFQGNIQFCRLARGSECLDHLTVCLENDYIDGKMFVDLETSIYSILKKLNGYIKYLRDKKNEK